MLLNNKIAIVHGAAGAVGSAVARAFAREGAKVFLAGRRASPLESLAKEIIDASGESDWQEVDALDEEAVEQHALGVTRMAGRIDILFNAVGLPAVQGIPLINLKREDFVSPIATWTTTQFLTARAAARHMIPKRSGVILTLSASPARLAIASTGGFGVACAAIEGLSRTLAAELSPQGVRVVCLRPHRIGDTLGAEADFAMEADEFRTFIERMTLLNRLPTLADVANTAVFLASDGAAAMSGTVANLTCGMSVD